MNGTSDDKTNDYCRHQNLKNRQENAIKLFLEAIRDERKGTAKFRPCSTPITHHHIRLHHMQTIETKPFYPSHPSCSLAGPTPHGLEIFPFIFDGFVWVFG
jgi:hypothetical protein